MDNQIKKYGEQRKLNLANWQIQQYEKTAFLKLKCFDLFEFYKI